MSRQLKEMVKVSGVQAPQKASKIQMHSRSNRAPTEGSYAHMDTSMDNQEKSKNDKYGMLDEKLSQRLALAFPKQKKTCKKRTTNGHPSDFKQTLTEDLIKARKQLELGEIEKETVENNSAQTGSVEGSHSSNTTRSHGSKSYNNDNDEDEEEVPIPEERKKPFGCKENMDSIRTSTYKLQVSEKPLQKLGTNVVGFK